jgi:hypothetical protein
MLSGIMLSVSFTLSVADYAECHSAECRGAEMVYLWSKQPNLPNTLQKYSVSCTLIWHIYKQNYLTYPINLAKV